MAPLRVARTTRAVLTDAPRCANGLAAEKSSLERLPMVERGRVRWQDGISACPNQENR